MRCSRVLLVVAAAVLCIAASGFAHEGPGCTVTTMLAGATNPVGRTGVRNDADKLMTAHRPLRAPPGDRGPVSIPNRPTKGRPK